MAKPRTEEQVADLLWNKCKLDHATGCWEWSGTVNHLGYGQLYWNRNGVRYRSAHRVSHAVFVSDPGDLHVLHKCDNRKCCNPGHLFLGTHQDNVKDMVSKGRQARNSLRGEKNGSSKLTEEQVKAIRSRLAAGETQASVAKEFGISQPSVHYVHSGKKWGWVNGASPRTAPCPLPSSSATEPTDGSPERKKPRKSQGEQLQLPFPPIAPSPHCSYGACDGGMF